MAPPSRTRMPSLREGLGGFDDVARRVHRRSLPRWSASSASCASSSASFLISTSRSGDGWRGLSLQRLDELRHDAAQVAHQRHVDRAVHADGGRILLDVDPLADRRCARPVAPVRP